MATKRRTSARQSRPSWISTRSSPPRISPSKDINGDVALNGSVPSYPQNQEADHLRPRDYRDDPTLTKAANNALALNILVPDDVEATASDGNVWLTGTVRHGSQRRAAVRPAGQGRRAGRCSR
jgi:BON domain